MVSLVIYKILRNPLTAIYQQFRLHHSLSNDRLLDTCWMLDGGVGCVKWVFRTRRMVSLGRTAGLYSCNLGCRPKDL